MKKGETPDLSAKWWKTSQPKGLASGAKLELALRAHDTAVAGFTKEASADRLKFALSTLEAVQDAVAKAIAEAGRVKGNPEMEFTAQALKKIDFKKETKQLEDSVEADADDDEEEADASALADPKRFAKILRKSLNRLDAEPWTWGFLVGKKPIDHRFLMHRTKNGRTLALAAAKELARPAKVSFGTVIRSPDDNGTIILTVLGANLASLATRVKKMLVKMKPQTVSEVLLMVDGVIQPEIVDPGDVDEPDDDEAGAPQGDAQTADPALEELHRRIAALEPRAAAVMDGMPTYRDRLTASIQQMMAAMEKEDATLAGSLLAKLEEIVTRLAAAMAQATQPSQSQASADRAQQAAAEIGAGLPGNVKSAVGLAKLRLRLTAARTARITAGANMEKACQALLDSGEYDDDPDLEQMRAAAAAVADRIPPLDPVTETVQDALDAAANANDPDVRARELQPAIKALDDYLSELDKDEMLRTLQSTSAGSFPIYDQVANAVRDLRNALAA